MESVGSDGKSAGAIAKDPKEVVRSWWNAMGRGDFDVVANYLADDMVWEVPGLAELLPHGGVWVGKEMVVRELFAFHAQAYDVKTCSFDITGLYADGPVVFMEFTVNSMTGRGRPYYGVKYVSVVKVENGKIKWAREYPDTLKAKTIHFD
jgi:ketosteroid isomerase-like protein